VFKAHRLVYHSTLGWRVIKKKKTNAGARHPPRRGATMLLKWSNLEKLD